MTHVLRWNQVEIPNIGLRKIQSRSFRNCCHNKQAVPYILWNGPVRRSSCISGFVSKRPKISGSWCFFFSAIFESPDYPNDCFFLFDACSGKISLFWLSWGRQFDEIDVCWFGGPGIDSRSIYTGTAHVIHTRQ